MVSKIKLHPNGNLLDMTYQSNEAVWEEAVSEKLRNCFTLKYPRSLSKGALATLDIESYADYDLEVFIHSPGMFQLSKRSDLTKVVLKSGNASEYKVNYESFDLLDYDGQPCNDSIHYRFDICKAEFANKVNSSV